MMQSTPSRKDDRHGLLPATVFYIGNHGGQLDVTGKLFGLLCGLDNIKVWQDNSMTFGKVVDSAIELVRNWGRNFIQIRDEYYVLEREGSPTSSASLKSLKERQIECVRSWGGIVQNIEQIKRLLIEEQRYDEDKWTEQIYSDELQLVSSFCNLALAILTEDLRADSGSLEALLAGHAFKHKRSKERPNECGVVAIKDLEFNAPEAPVSVHLKPDVLLFLVERLISNAVHANVAGKPLGLEIKPALEHGMVCISVTNWCNDEFVPRPESLDPNRERRDHGVALPLVCYVAELAGASVEQVCISDGDLYKVVTSITLPALLAV